MKGTRVVIGAAVAAAVLAIVYIVNPLHTPSYDPRLRFWGVTVFRAPARSMEPTIRAGDIFLVYAWPYRTKDPIVGDIIVFQYPVDRSVAYVKRVLATGGSAVEIRDGSVVVDGKTVYEPYLNPKQNIENYSRTMPPLRVPLNSYFVLGDNRDHSNDSRVWGFVPRSNIIGEVYR